MSLIIKDILQDAAKVSLLFFALGLVAKSAEAETLKEALAYAYRNNPGLEAQRAYLRSVDEGVAQAKSGWRPTISLEGNVTRSRTEGEVKGREIETSLLTSSSATVSVAQPIYRGGRTFAQVKQAKEAVKAERAILLNTEQNILLEAALAYMDVAMTKAVLGLNTQNQSVLQKHLDATEERFDVGVVTRTDVMQAKARLAGAEATTKLAAGNYQSAIASYEKIIGHRPEKIEQINISSADMPKTLSQAIDSALKNNPAVIAAEHQYNIKKAQKKGIKGELLPTVSLAASATRAWDAEVRNSRLDILQGGAQVSVPLYQAGGTSARLRAAKQQISQFSLNIENTKRNVTNEITAAWTNYEATKASIAATMSQIESAKLALEGVEQEHKVGERTVLDVLDAEQELLDAKVALITATRNKNAAALRLIAGVGRLTAENFGLDTPIYHPEAHYNSVKNKFFGFNTVED